MPGFFDIPTTDAPTTPASGGGFFDLPTDTGNSSSNFFGSNSSVSNAVNSLPARQATYQDIPNFDISKISVPQTIPSDTTAKYGNISQETISQAPPESFWGKVGDFFGSIGNLFNGETSASSTTRQNARTQIIQSLTDSTNNQPYVDIAKQLGVDKAVDPNIPAGVDTSQMTPNVLQWYKEQAAGNVVKNNFDTIQKQFPDVKLPTPVQASDIEKQIGQDPNSLLGKTETMAGILGTAAIAIGTDGLSGIVQSLAEGGWAEAAPKITSLAKNIGIFTALDKITTPLRNELVQKGNIGDGGQALLFVAQQALNVLGTHGATKGIDGLIDMFAKHTVTSYKLPETFTISGADIQKITGADKMSSTQIDQMAKDLGWTNEQKNALKNGATVTTPSYRIITTVDKPWWGKVKSLFGFEPTNTVNIDKAGGEMSSGALPGKSAPTPEDLQNIVQQIKGGGTPAGPVAPIPKDLQDIVSQVKSTNVIPKKFNEKVGPNEILVGRHGDIAKVDDGIAHGQTQDKLTPEGKTDAKKLGTKWAKQGVTRIVSSDLPRGKETAMIASKATGATVKTDPLLRTWDIGKFDGQPKTTVDPQLAYYRAHPTEVIPGGESYKAFTDRIQKGLVANKKPGTAFVLHNEILKSLGHNFDTGETKTIPFKGPTEATPSFSLKPDKGFVGKDPVINLKRDLVIRNVAGEKVTLKAGDAYTPHLRADGKILLQDGIKILINKSTYETVKQNSKTEAEAKEFAPELKSTEETVKGQESSTFTKPDGTIVHTTKGAPTKYEKYQLPGGKNYKEILIQAPTKTSKGATDLTIKENKSFPKPVFEVFDNSGNKINQFRTEEDAKSWIEIQKNIPLEVNQTSFKSSHWEEPNVIAHVRMNERTYDGKKVAFMEEMQSDWAREGRQKGFQQATQNPESLLPEGWKVITSDGDTFYVVDENGNKVPDKLATGGSVLAYGGNKNVAIGKAIGDETLLGNFKSGVPNNPLLKNWQELALKRALIEAVDSGAKYFAWTNGEQQQARYNLSKEVYGITWRETSGQGGKEVIINPKQGGDITVLTDPDGKIVTQGGNIPSNWAGKNIADVIGKGIGQKIMSEERGGISGEGLNIGGEWASNLYDKQIPQIVKQLTGEKPEVIDMGLGKESTNKEAFTNYETKEPVTPENIKIGQRINIYGKSEDFIVSKILPEGKFEAVNLYKISDSLSNNETPKQYLDVKAYEKRLVAKNGEGQREWIDQQVKNREKFIKNYTETFQLPTKGQVGQQAIKLTPEVKAIVKGEAPQLKQPSGAEPQFNEAQIERPELPERLFQPQRVEAYIDRLKLRGIDPVELRAIITPDSTAWGVSYGSKLGFTGIVQHLTEDHEIFHQVFSNMENMRVFKDFDKGKLLEQAKSLYGDLSPSQLEENLARDYQHYVNDIEAGKSTSFWGKILEFFQRLYTSMKQIFSNERDINDFYEAVHERTATEETQIKDTGNLQFNEQFKKGGVVDFGKEIPGTKQFNEKPNKDITKTPEFKEWFKDSKIVDEDGNPLLVYHGTTSAPFDTFDEKMIGNRDSGWFGKGFYFALSKGEASSYGHNVMPAYLNIKNPFVWQDQEDPNFKGYAFADSLYLTNLLKFAPELAKKITTDVFNTPSTAENNYTRTGTRINMQEYKNLVDSEKIDYTKEIYDQKYGVNTQKVLEYRFKGVGGGEGKITLNYNGKEPSPELLKHILFDKKYSVDIGGGLYGVEREIAQYGDEFTDALKARGYDGTMQSHDGDEYVAFKADQIAISKSNLPAFNEKPDLAQLRGKLETAQGHLDMAVANQELFGDKIPDLKQKVLDLRAQIQRVKYPPAETAKEALANAEKRVGVKSTNPEQISRMLDREQVSLAAANEMPDAHEKAYGRDKRPEYQEKINELTMRLEEATPKPSAVTAPKIRVSDKDVQIPERLYQRQLDVEMKKEAIDNSPYQQLMKYVAKSGEYEGKLPEVLGQTAGQLKGGTYGKIKNPNVLNWIRNGDQIIQQVFGAGSDYESAPDIEDIRANMEDYLQSRKDLTEERKQVLKDVKSYIASEKDRIALERMNQAQGEAEQKIRTKEEQISDKKKEAESLQDWKNFISTHAEEQSLPQSLEEVAPPIVRGGIQSPELNFAKWKDKSVPRLGRETFERNIENVAPKEDDTKLKKFIIDPVRKNELDRVKFNNELREKTQETLKNLGLRRGTKSSELIQQFGEGLISLGDLQNVAPKNWKQIQDASNYYRNEYDKLIDRWNEVRKEFGYPEIGKRKDYFRHFDEVNFFTKNYGVLTKQDELPTEIAGKTEFFKPGKPFTTAELSRTGRQTKYDAIAGFDNYIDTVSKQIFHIDSIQRGRALERYLEEAAKVAARLGSPLQLQHIIANLHEYVNNQLAGKMAILDRSVEGTVGRPVVRAIETITKLIGKNVIVGNISTALSHMVTLPLIMSTANKLPLMKGLMTTFTSPLKAEPFNTIEGQESSFLTRRYPVEQTQRTRLQTAEHALSFLFEQTDKFKARLAVSSKYYEGIEKGLSPKDAMAEADRYAGRVVGDYSIGQKPNWMNTKTLGILAQFQLGLNDSMSVLFHDIPESEKEYFKNPETGETESRSKKWSMVYKWAQYALYAYLFNLVLKQIRGAGKGLDVVGAGLDLAGVGSTTGQPFGQRAGTAFKDIAGELPFIGLFTGNFPLSTAFQGVGKKFSSGDYVGGAEDVASLFASPIGGGQQIKKTLTGIQAIRQGYVTTKSGLPAFVTPQGVGGYIQAGIFGPTANPAAQAYYQSIGAPSKAKATYDEIQQLLKDGKVAEATAITSAMTTREYGAYKAEKTRAAEIVELPEAMKIMGMIKSGDTAGATKITEAMTPEQYKIYQGAKARLLKATSGTASNNNNGIATFEGHTTHLPGSKDITPATFTQSNPDDGQIASYNPNGEPIYARDTKLEAQRRAQLIAQDPYWSVTASQLDHVQALEAGGTNTADNMVLISKAADEGNQPFEDFLGGLYKSGGISRADALKASIDYKIKKTVSLTDVMNGKY